MKARWYRVLDIPLKKSETLNTFLDTMNTFSIWFENSLFIRFLAYGFPGYNLFNYGFTVERRDNFSSELVKMDCLLQIPKLLPLCWQPMHSSWQKYHIASNPIKVKRNIWEYSPLNIWKIVLLESLQRFPAQVAPYHDFFTALKFLQKTQIRALHNIKVNFVTKLKEMKFPSSPKSVANI